jgi:molybdopterin/thiamine biosynthesis adenylyltransferase
VHKFTLIDPDYVSVQNICRCEFDLFDLGLPKPTACRNRMLAINPRVEVNVHVQDVRKMNPDVLEAVIQRASLVIWSTDNPDVQRVGNGLTYHRIPALYPGVYPQGTGGEVIITIPDETPCLECVLKGLLSQPVQRKGAWDYATEGQLKPEPALIADIQNVVTHTTKLALALLSRGKEKSRLKDFIDPKLSVLFIGNEVEKDWIFEYPFQTVWASAEVDPECWCRGMR